MVGFVAYDEGRGIPVLVPWGDHADEAKQGATSQR